MNSRRLMSAPDKTSGQIKLAHLKSEGEGELGPYSITSFYPPKADSGSLACPLSAKSRLLHRSKLSAAIVGTGEFSPAVGAG
jgi:hypothetical protein